VNWAARWGGLALCAIIGGVYFWTAARARVAWFELPRSSLQVTLWRGRLEVWAYGTWPGKTNAAAPRAFGYATGVDEVPWSMPLLGFSAGWKRVNPIALWDAAFPLWPIALVGAAIASWGERVRRCAPRGACPSCTYDLSGLPPGSPCPECAAASPHADTEGRRVSSCTSLWRRGLGAPLDS
jgi:hypothetical protein